MNTKKMTKKEKGFTLVESLISIAILMISIVAPLSVASSSLIAAKIAEKQITAAYLAQDALEYIINIKAGSKIENYTGTGGLFAGNLSQCFGTGCKVNTISGNIEGCSNDADCKQKLKINNSTGVYSYISGSDSTYSRVIKISRLEDLNGNILDSEAVVDVTVFWNSLQDGNEKSYTLTSNLTKW